MSVTTRPKARVTTCIYCGQAAGSREHLFLASCGGLREDTSILCATCNGEFGRTLDIQLAASLREINGLLGVQDRNRKRQPAIFNDPTTEVPYEVDRYGAARVAQLIIRNESTEGNVKRFEVTAGTQKQIDDWVASQKASGLKVVSRTRPRVSHTSGPPRLSKQVTFSNKETLRESARIALNFLSHFEPQVARMPELIHVKQYVKNPSSPEHAFHTMIDPQDHFGENSFRFGHRVVLVYDLDQTHLYALVSYFSALTVLVNLGKLTLTAPFVKVVDIDPLAERLPDDLRQRDDIELAPESIPYQPVTEDDNDRFFDATEDRFVRLIEDIHLYQREQVPMTISRYISQTGNQLTEEELYARLACADALIFDSLQAKILRISEEIEKLDESHAGYKVVVDVLRHMVGRPETATSSEIHPSMVAIVEACRRKATRIILEQHSKGVPITQIFLSGLLSEKGVIGHCTVTLVNQIVRATLGQQGYEALSKRLSHNE